LRTRFGLEMGEQLEVTKVIADSAATRAGVQVGDRLTAVWGEPLESTVDIYRAWREHREEEKVEFTVKRAGSERKMTAVFANPEPPKTDATPTTQPTQAPASGAKGATSSGAR